ncbi:MAG: KdsC family phosphatase [Acidobacteriota bacterium]
MAAPSDGPPPEPLAHRLRSLRLILLDVDGVLTDGGLYFTNGGEELKRFDVKDGAGIVLARKAGLAVGLLTGKTSEIVSRRALELGLSPVRQGALDKTGPFAEILAEAGVEAREVGYVGDDVLDLPILRRAGVSACPADAHPLVRKKVDLVLSAPGGRGAVREFIDRVLEARGLLLDTERPFWEVTEDA